MAEKFDFALLFADLVEFHELNRGNLRVRGRQ